VFFTKPLFSQSFSSHPIALTPTVFPDYTFNEDEYMLQLMNRLSEETDRDLLFEYSQISAANKKYFFNSNEIYYNWEEATEFVKKVFLKTVPQGYNTEKIKIFIIRSPDFNAYCMEDGNIAVTTGFLAFMNNEAELAAVLSHEYGHFYCNHNYYGFKEKKKAVQKRLKAYSVGSKTGFGDYFHHLRDAERSADTFELNFVKRNGYATQSILTNFESLNKIHLKYESLRGYRQRSSYFSTHPSNKERIKKAQSFITANGLTGKLFQVDSNLFMNIKKRAVDECIYLLHEELRFDECLELSFFQHLFFPQDEFYLYFILECLKSKMASEQYYGRYPFITAYYDPAKLNDKAFNPYCKNSNFNSYEKKPEFKYSIFNNLQGVIYSLSNVQSTQMKTIELLKKDTIPFFTNQQALNYFSKKIPKESNVFNSIRLKLDMPVEKECSEDPAKSKLENDLCRIYSNLKSYDSKWDSLDYGMMVLNDVNLYQYTGGTFVHFSDLAMEKNIYSKYGDFAKSNKYMWIINDQALNFRERSKIKHIANFNQHMVANSLFGTSADIDFLQVCPEFVMQSIKNKVETIFIIDLYLYSVDYSQAYIYGVDIRNKRITVTKLPLGCSYKSSPEDIFKKVFLECESLIKN